MEKRQPPQELEPKQGTILLTGANGRIGRVLSASLTEKFDIVRLDKQTTDEEMLGVDIGNIDELRQAFSNMPAIDAIVHLAANPNADAPWEEVVKNNIIGTQNMYACAREFGVKRVIFASSTHLVGAYEGYPKTSPLGRPITVFDAARPDGDYGASKGYGELLARQYFDLYGIESICIRIGALGDTNEPTPPYEKLWLSYDDAAQVFEKALRTNIPFGIYFATSENDNPVYDIELTKQDLGYNPTDGMKKT